MKRKYLLWIILLFLALPAVIWAAQKTIVTYTWDRDIKVSSDKYTINFDEHIADFDFSASTSGAMSVNTTDKTANLGNSRNDSCGVLWYSGDNSQVANCTEGKCNFGCGFRAYFDFRFATTDTSANSTARGDGFTFAVINGSNNTVYSRGGPAGTASMGELMCYAGTGSSGAGIHSPKMAIEFDTYGNTGAMSNNGCSSGRADPNNLNHIALMFWGDNKTGNCTVGGTSCSQAPYDDNIHNQCVSSCTNPGPVNSNQGDNGYCQRTGGKVGSYNWMEDDQTHRVRVEVVRATQAVGATYPYNIKVWVDCEEACCSSGACSACLESELPEFQNVFRDYVNEAYPPKINRNVQLNSTDHADFNKMIFGFTEGTGGATQNILISNFKLYFPCSLPCEFGINPTNRGHNGEASSGNTITVWADDGCSWSAVSNNPSWITITAGASGTGNGTVTYSLAANNTGSPRTGSITIAGMIFTVTQDAIACTYAIVPTSRSHGAAAVTGQTVTVTAGAGCPWTAVSNNAWIIVTGGASGTGNGTVTYRVTTNTGAARTGTITIGGQTFTVYQAAPCSAYTVYNRTGGWRDFTVSGSACIRAQNNNPLGVPLESGGTVTRYWSTNGTCWWAQGTRTYADAIEADINGNCVVRYNSNDTLSDQ